MQKLTLCTVLLGFLCCELRSTPVYAGEDELRLRLNPNRCVALRQGQVCYQRITIQWSALQPQFNYCLVEQGRTRPLHCWQGGTAGEFVYEFGSDKSRHIQLQREDGIVEEQLQIVVAWVYKNRHKRRSAWRLF